MGSKTIANQDYSVAMGNNTIAHGTASTAMGESITVIKEGTLGNGGPIYGQKLYNKLVETSGNVISDASTNCLNRLNTLQIYKSTENQHDYTLGNTLLGTTHNFFDVSMIGDISAVNITQLVYTLVGAVQELQHQISNIQSSLT